MDLIVNFSVQSVRGEPVRPITDLRIPSLFGKTEEEVLAELAERSEAIIATIYTTIVGDPGPWED